jgi:hypothetical protein
MGGGCQIAQSGVEGVEPCCLQWSTVFGRTPLRYVVCMVTPRVSGGCASVVLCLFALSCHGVPPHHRVVFECWLGNTAPFAVFAKITSILIFAHPHNI